jgi:hypothetical protein
MIKKVFIRKGDKAWLLSISAWLGICKDGAKDAGYAFPEEDETDAQFGVPGDILAIQIDNWMKADFAAFLHAYERGDINPPKAPVVKIERPTKEVVEAVIAEMEKPKATRKKK